jgi:hypothetical protein
MITMLAGISPWTSELSAKSTQMNPTHALNAQIGRPCMGALSAFLHHSLRFDSQA